MKRQVYCTLQIEGTHFWKECRIDEVHYLKHPHRHLFVIKAVIDVSHDDRDVEFICLKHQVRDYLIKQYGVDHNSCHFGGMSCEMIALELINEFKLFSCEVSEDNENGAIVYAK